MKNLGRILWITIIIVLMVSAVTFATTFTPGSDQDPVVTLSYVKSQIDELRAYIDLKNNNTGSTQIETDNKAVTYEIINLKSGEKLIGKESTEIILRSGEATSIDNGANGISDITDGKDLRSGDIVIANHLLLVPRDDGRGITAVTEIYVMVKGGYEIK